MGSQGHIASVADSGLFQMSKAAPMVLHTISRCVCWLHLTWLKTSPLLVWAHCASLLSVCTTLSKLSCRLLASHTCLLGRSSQRGQLSCRVLSPSFKAAAEKSLPGVVSHCVLQRLLSCRRGRCAVLCCRALPPRHRRAAVGCHGRETHVAARDKARRAHQHCVDSADSARTALRTASRVCALASPVGGKSV